VAMGFARHLPGRARLSCGGREDLGARAKTE
jgi:hypothetical protein